VLEASRTMAFLGFHTRADSSPAPQEDPFSPFGFFSSSSVYLWGTSRFLTTCSFSYFSGIPAMAVDLSPFPSFCTVAFTAFLVPTPFEPFVFLLQTTDWCGSFFAQSDREGKRDSPPFLFRFLSFTFSGSTVSCFMSPRILAFYGCSETLTSRPFLFFLPALPDCLWPRLDITLTCRLDMALFFAEMISFIDHRPHGFPPRFFDEIGRVMLTDSPPSPKEAFWFDVPPLCYSFPRQPPSNCFSFCNPGATLKFPSTFVSVFSNKG